MHLEEILDDPLRTLRYLERYVNDGSPSGFSKRYTTSVATSPFGDVESFSLFLLQGEGQYFREFGNIPSWPIHGLSLADNWLLVHPDMVAHNDIKRTGLKVQRIDSLLVAPTSSGRTVQFLPPRPQDYVKLHYDAVLGRVNRALPFGKAIAGPEVSGHLTRAMKSGLIDQRLCILPETGARTVSIGNEDGAVEWGMVWRSGTPTGPAAADIRAMIPAFSLFSSDRYHRPDPPLLIQLMRMSGLTPQSFLLDKIIDPILSCYFSLVTQLGLQPEWNAQNLLVGCDKNGHIISIVARDLESVDKDLTLREQLGLSIDFKTYPFKCLHRDQYNYRIKHSFMFDHKLGDYLMHPILECIVSYTDTQLSELQEAVKTRADHLLCSLPPDFFPEDGHWYMFKKVLIDQSTPERPYVRFPNPRFRTIT